MEVFMIYYSIKEISPIKINVSKILFKEEEYLKNLKETENFVRYNTKRTTKIKAKEKGPKEKENYPPKKGKVRKSKQVINNLVTENYNYGRFLPLMGYRIKEKYVWKIR